MDQEGYFFIGWNLLNNMNYPNLCIIYVEVDIGIFS